MAIKTYLQRAKRKWPHAEWITGNGRFALLAHCGVLTVSLWRNLEDAIKQKEFIDRYACGGACHKNHEIIELNEMVKKEQKMNKIDFAEALKAVFISPNEVDSNLEPANVVDALCKIARAIYTLAEVIEKQGAVNKEEKRG